MYKTNVLVKTIIFFKYFSSTFSFILSLATRLSMRKNQVCKQIEECTSCTENSGFSRYLCNVFKWTKTKNVFLHYNIV